MSNSFLGIHTIEFKYIPDYATQVFINQNFIYNRKRSRKEKHAIYTYQPNRTGLRYEYHIIDKPEYKSKYLVVIANPKKVLGKDNLLIEDFYEFTKKYKFLILQDFSLSTIETEMFSRIDYFVDILLELHKKTLLLKLYKKLINEYRGMKKKVYKSSINYNSKSKRINIYSRFEKKVDIYKEEYFMDPEKVNVDTEIIPYINQADKNTLRFEVQVKRKKIQNYLKSDGTCPELVNYWNCKDALHFLNETLKPILFNGDYYYSYGSKIKLQQYHGNRLVESLLNFQTYISNHGLDAARKKYKNHSKYIGYLQDSGVNPILIPYNESIKFMENPLKFIKGNVYINSNVESLINNTKGIVGEAM